MNVSESKGEICKKVEEPVAVVQTDRAGEYLLEYRSFDMVQQELVLPEIVHKFRFGDEVLGKSLPMLVHYDIMNFSSVEIGYRWRSVRSGHLWRTWNY